jgi:organic radical activating enzyme
LLENKKLLEDKAMFDGVPNKFNYTIKRIFGKDIKIITHCCNRVEMGCCGGGGGGCRNSIFIHTNSYCNSNCFFCITERKQAEIKDFEKLSRVISELVDKKAISKAVLTGGEPLMHPRFSDFLSLLDGFPLEWYSLNTNGTLIDGHIDSINSSNLRHINISLHHFDDSQNREIMGRCLTFDDVSKIRRKISDNIEIRMACTITEHCHTEAHIMAYIERVKKCGIDNVIFRNEYRGYNRYLAAFRKIWSNLFTADICNCGYKLIDGVNSEYRESNVKLKQAICDANSYFRDFIYKDDDMLSGSWEYGSQVIY